MLEMVDLSQELSPSAYRQAMGPLEIRIGELQRAIRERCVPVIIVFEGWDAAGKGELINRLLLSLDSRGFTVHPIVSPKEDEALRPWLWRFWTRTPEAGRIAIFDRSWYGGVLGDRIDRAVKKRVWRGRFAEINAFERELIDGGTIIIKLFLHISKAEQGKRLRKLADHRSTAWKVTEEDWRHHRQYDRYADAVEEMFEATAVVPWNVVECHDRHFATVRVFRTVIENLERVVAHAEASEGKAADAARLRLPRMRGSVLETVNLNRTLSRPKYEREIDVYRKRVAELQHEVYLARVPVVVAYEGWDAAGKGGTIRRLVQGLDPRGYEVVPISAPSDIEKRHHYLYRFWIRFPKAGHVTIFDRTWYGRVLVERVEGFCTEREWKRAYAEINETEEQWVSAGAVIVKLWLHIDKNEQLRRFEARQRTPFKQWKITPEDWRNRERWDQYREAVDEMLYRTSTAHAPWTIVEATSKLYARVKALKTITNAIERRLGPDRIGGG